VGARKASWGIGYALSFTSIVLFMAIGVMTLALSRFLSRDIRRRQEEEPLPGGLSLTKFDLTDVPDFQD
jgi:hypothetical protein